jgi:hypothetical protein
VAGGDGQGATQCQYPLAHSGQTQAEPLVRPHPSAIIAHAHASASAAARYSRRLFRRLDGDADTCRTGVAKDIRQGFLHDAVDR